MISKLKMASIGDIHLGHPNTTTKEIIANLRLAFPDNAETGELDMIVFEGDVFDRLLSLPDDNVFAIKTWINSFLRMCKKRDIVVRVLEGTPSHDWGQSRLFVSVNDSAEIGVDLKYVNDLRIEYIQKFDMTILYVPDEWEAEPDETWKQVQRLLVENGIDKVDIAVMHGSFEYQLPSHVKVPHHSSERYLSIVRHYIFIGHIHRHTVYDRILAAGSFDRLGQNEEEPKGHLRVVIRDDGRNQMTFVENKTAKIYKTIKCSGLTIDEALEKIAVECKDLPNGSRIRVEAETTDAVVSGIDVLRMKYPLLVWDTKLSTKAVSGNDMLVDMRERYSSIAIDKGNIAKLLMERIAGKTDDPLLLKRCAELIEEVAL